MMDRFISTAYKFLHFGLTRIVGNLSAILLLVGTVFAILEIFRRYVLGVVFDWGQDAVIFVMAAAMFLYFPVAQAARAHLVMSALIDCFRSKRLTKTVSLTRFLVSVFSTVICGSFAVWSIPTVVRSIETDRRVLSMAFEIWPFQLCLTISFALMGLVAFFQSYQDLRALMGKDVFDWVSAEETTDL